MKKLSVVITAYNEEKNLPGCLTALINQTLPKDDFEILVVDNNSKDNTVEIAKSFGASVVSETRQGNTFALSKGLSSANGEVLVSTDADTIADKDWLRVILNTFEDKKVAGATGSVKINSGNGFFDFLSEKFYEYFFRFNFLIGKPHFCGFNFAIRKSVFDEIGGVNEKFTMSPDVDLGLRAAKKGKIKFVSNMTVLTSIRRWHENPSNTFSTYLKGYLWAAWLRVPPPVKQNVVR